MVSQFFQTVAYFIHLSTDYKQINGVMLSRCQSISDQSVFSPAARFIRLSTDDHQFKLKTCLTATSNQKVIMDEMEEEPLNAEEKQTKDLTLMREYVRENFLTVFKRKTKTKGVDIMNLFHTTVYLEMVETNTKKVSEYAKMMLSTYDLDFYIFQLFYLLAYDENQTQTLVDFLSWCKTEHLMILDAKIQNLELNPPH